ncbi:MAG: tryptophan synthase subunit alpha [Brevinematales bacterium]|nr:tryptophan synthase subunit alpha [Brevinematales bacterium]
MLTNYINERRKSKEILLMTHIVIGYPDIKTSLKIVETMVNAGVDLMELQIPFSEPIADGPTILYANHLALKNGVRTRDCFEFAAKITSTFDIPFLFMTYYNILFKYGVKNFVFEMEKVAIKGAIVPDLPPEEGEEYISSMKGAGISPIFIFTPTSKDGRLRLLSSFADGFVYCVARKGITGQKTDFNTELTKYIDRCKSFTSLPLALGFGIKEREEIDFLKDKVDIAVIGTQSIKVFEEKGIFGLKEYLKNLR